MSTWSWLAIWHKLSGEIDLHRKTGCVPIKTAQMEVAVLKKLKYVK